MEVYDIQDVQNIIKTQTSKYIKMCVLSRKARTYLNVNVGADKNVSNIDIRILPIKYKFSNQ